MRASARTLLPQPTHPEETWKGRETNNNDRYSKSFHFQPFASPRNSKKPRLTQTYTSLGHFGTIERGFYSYMNHVGLVLERQLWRSPWPFVAQLASGWQPSSKSKFWCEFSEQFIHCSSWGFTAIICDSFSTNSLSFKNHIFVHYTSLQWIFQSTECVECHTPGFLDFHGILRLRTPPEIFGRPGCWHWNKHHLDVWKSLVRFRKYQKVMSGNCTQSIIADSHYGCAWTGHAMGRIDDNWNSWNPLRASLGMLNLTPLSCAVGKWLVQKEKLAKCKKHMKQPRPIRKPVNYTLSLSK